MDQPPPNLPGELTSSGRFARDRITEPGLASPVIGGSAIVRHAEALVHEFGADASAAAALRAAHSRARDNPYSYCQWREVARVLGWMDDQSKSATQH